VERGAHHELVARLGGEYAALWRKQTRGARTERQPV
jgi:ATP-binding cassette subfamily B protein